MLDGHELSLNTVAASEMNPLFDTNQNLECMDLSLLFQLNIKMNSPIPLSIIQTNHNNILAKVMVHGH